MSSDTDDDEGQTRPISVAELLARNGTIGAPPAGGHRRRRRGNPTAVSVAELTGEMPVIRDVPEPPVEVQAEVQAEADAVVAEAEIAVEPEVAAQPEVAAEPEPGPEVAVVIAEATTEAPATGDDVVMGDVVSEGVVTEGVVTGDVVPEGVSDEDVTQDVVAEEDVTEDVVTESRPSAGAVRTAPPLAGDPRPRRWGRPERSHDPRPLRRSSGAEQMAYDPVDESVDLAELVGEQEVDEETLRSYLKASGGTLFSGETVADDLARRGIADADEATAAPARSTATAGGGRLAALRHGAAAILQSVLAVLFGAGLFLGFDQLWRWNTIVALVLSVLVILGLVIAVRVVRKTEDIASTLIAVAVGALVTLGPLALLQSYG